MRNIKKSTIAVLAVAALAVSLVFAFSAIADDAAPAEMTDDATMEMVDEAAEMTDDVAALPQHAEFVDDATCLMCHGGNYDSLAEMTEQYLQSNPHNSIHGGFNSCVNCHIIDGAMTESKCDNCHGWPHNPAA